MSIKNDKVDITTTKDRIIEFLDLAKKDIAKTIANISISKKVESNEHYLNLCVSYCFSAVDYLDGAQNLLKDLINHIKG